MKNIFGVNTKTQTAGEINIDGKPFVVCAVDGELKERLKEVRKEQKYFQKKAFPPWLLALNALSFFFGFILLAVFFDAASDSSFAEVYAKSSWMLYVGVLFLLFGVFITLCTVRRIKAVYNSSSFQNTEERMEKVAQDSRIALGVPDDAKFCDIFAYLYQIKSNGKTKPAKYTEYTTWEFSAFREDETLCLADIEKKLRIPLENVCRFYRVNKRTTTSGWTKETAINKGEYKQYKIRMGKYGTIFIKPYYILEIQYQNEEFELKFPCYEYETFRALLGRDADIS